MKKLKNITQTNLIPWQEIETPTSGLLTDEQLLAMYDYPAHMKLSLTDLRRRDILKASEMSHRQNCFS